MPIKVAGSDRKPGLRVHCPVCAVPSKRKTRRCRKPLQSWVEPVLRHDDVSGAKEHSLPAMIAMENPAENSLLSRMQDAVDAERCDRIDVEEFGSGGTAACVDVQPLSVMSGEVVAAGRSPRALVVKQCAFNAASLVQAILAFGVLNAVILRKCETPLFVNAFKSQSNPITSGSLVGRLRSASRCTLSA